MKKFRCEAGLRAAKRKAIAVFAVLLMMAAGLLCACGGEEGQSQSGADGERSVRAGLSMTVDASDGAMKISRPQLDKSAPMGEEDSWTIFVYMCGSDLESRLLFGGMATQDIKEMRKASASDNVRFVIECGGASLWHSLDILGEPDERFVIEDGKLNKVSEAKRSTMGKSKTLTNFLRWGVKNYPAEKMGLIFWDHGGGSISGVCFDENHDDDSLTLREIDASLLSAMDVMTDKFEFIGFDACLMGTAEMANIAASYARYMYGSQESEPGGGWDYKAIGNYLAKHPEADGAALGKVVCDSYQKSCEEVDQGQMVTMSVIDLSVMNKLVKRFNKFAKEMYSASSDSKVMGSMVRKINKADNFGGNNKSEGYTNMVDLGGLVSACKGWTESSSNVRKTIKQAVVYQVRGSDHSKASGLSLYFPLAVQSSKELKIFNTICISPYYLSFVDKQGHSSVEHGYDEEYEDDTWFEDGFWSWIDLFFCDEADRSYTFDEEEASGDYWSFIDDFEATGESPLITFSQEPAMGRDGIYSFCLDEEGLENAASVSALVYQLAEDEKTYIELGETLDVEGDWQTGRFKDYFDGCWLSLPDGQNLALYVVDVTDDYVIYTSPILLNGEETNLRMRQDNNGRVQVEGAWDGIDDQGAASRNILPVQKGDVIIPTYFSEDARGREQDEYAGDEYKVGRKFSVDYDLMPAGDYDYAFCIDDAYGDYYVSEMAQLRIDPEGDILFSR